MSVLSVRGLSAGYGRVGILRDVSFEVGQGEVTLVLGPNGAGKTTLLRALSGGCTVTGGQVLTGDRDLVGMAPFKIARAGIGHVAEGRQLFPAMSVSDNLDLGIMGASAEVRARRAEIKKTVLSLFPVLEKRRRQQAGTMSGGEQQMLAIGRALMSEPTVILLDEPSTGLAPGIYQAVLRALGEVGARGTGVVLVEQVVPERIPLPGRALLLNDGRIVHSGPIDEVVAMPNLWDIYRGSVPEGGQS
jgi:branched-chain amino acid transport system ATP-binding protein